MFEFEDGDHYLMAELKISGGGEVTLTVEAYGDPEPLYVVDDVELLPRGELVLFSFLEAKGGSDVDEFSSPLDGYVRTVIDPARLREGVQYHIRRCAMQDGDGYFTDLAHYILRQYQRMVHAPSDPRDPPPPFRRPDPPEDVIVPVRR